MHASVSIIPQYLIFVRPTTSWESILITLMADDFFASISSYLARQRFGINFQRRCLPIGEVSRDGFLSWRLVTYLQLSWWNGFDWRWCALTVRLPVYLPPLYKKNIKLLMAIFRLIICDDISWYNFGYWY